MILQQTTIEFSLAPARRGRGRGEGVPGSGHDFKRSAIARTERVNPRDRALRRGPLTPALSLSKGEREFFYLCEIASSETGG
jgi:hypothetical protein